MPSIIIDAGNEKGLGYRPARPPLAAEPQRAAGRDIALVLARRIVRSLAEGAGAARARAADKEIKVHLAWPQGAGHGRNSPVGLASDLEASLFLGLHFNDFDGETRGTEAWIDRKNRAAFETAHVGAVTVAVEGPGKPGSGARNPNHVDDAAFAGDLAQAVYDTIALYDWGAQLRSTHYYAEHHGEDYLPPPGVKMMGLDGLEEAVRGSAATRCRACLLGVEFIDHPAVKRLFNGESLEAFHDRLADSIAEVLVDWA